MLEKRCTKCGQTKPLSDFNFRSKPKGLHNTRCKICTRVVTRSAYYKNRHYYLGRVAERNKTAKKRTQQFLFNFLCQKTCIDCGATDPVILQFDHVRGEKRFSIATMINQRQSLKAVVAEMAKCVVRCANCHARKTARERGYYAYLTSLD